MLLHQSCEFIVCFLVFFSVEKRQELEEMEEEVWYFLLTLVEYHGKFYDFYVMCLSFHPSVSVHPSLKFYHIHLLFQEYWVNYSFKQTSHKAFLA